MYYVLVHISCLNCLEQKGTCVKIFVFILFSRGFRFQKDSQILAYCTSFKTKPLKVEKMN